MPHEEACRLLDAWARLPDGPAKQLAQDAFFAHRKRLAGLLEALVRATIAEGGPGDTLRAAVGEDVATALERRFDLWQKVLDETLRQLDRAVHDNRRLWSKIDKLERRVKELEDARPQLRHVPG